MREAAGVRALVEPRLIEPRLAEGLVVEGLSVAYGAVRAVDDVSFTVRPGEILGLVGESGSGKSTAVLGAMRLLPPPGAIVGGSVHLGGADLLAMDAAALRKVWGEQVALVPQGALSALNPVLTLGEHVAETLRAHPERAGASSGGLSRAAIRARAVALVGRVGLDPVHLDAYPHALSGGMRQRATLALALALDPPLLVLDEPTTALDVVVEREILRRLLALQEASGFAMVFITHDLALLLELATHIGVLYAGRLVEHGPVRAFHPDGGGGRHPYTRGLLAALPPAPGEDRVPISIPGHAASVAAPPSGCRFHPRCALATAPCAAVAPSLSPRASGSAVACHEVP
ncbi:MAG: ABC transporter ATP-binding protein [Pseudomonadota bacterium]|nr:ABC transporter ATP-binding protein [Pseudomonadota bacterium]